MNRLRALEWDDAKGVRDLALLNTMDPAIRDSRYWLRLLLPARDEDGFAIVDGLKVDLVEPHLPPPELPEWIEFAR